MKKLQKKFLLPAVLLPLLVLLICAVSLLVTAQTPEPSVSIERFNLTFENNIYIKYAVKVGGVEQVNTNNFGVLIWREPQTVYEKGSEDALLSTLGKQEIDGEEYDIFAYKDIAAKEMTDDIYARAYLEVGGKVYYSAVEKYSILQYAYNKLGITGTASTNENLKAMLRNMLEYGASAQIYFNYKTDRLATADFHQITVEGGTLADGTYSGLYAVGESVIMNATEINKEGVAFAHWINSDGSIVSTDLIYTATVSNKNETYTAVYGEASVETPAEYFYFTKLADGTYSVEANDPTNVPAEIIIPIEHEGKPVTVIADMGFAECPSLTNVIIPKGITTIGASAFWNCNVLESVTIADSVTSIGASAFYNCLTLRDIALPSNLSAIENSTFKECTNLRAVSIGTSVETIDTNAFYNCYNLAAVVIPNSVTTIGENAFYNCNSMTTLTIGNAVETIGGSAFCYCSKLTNVIIPDSVATIGKSAFQYCSNLTTLTIGNHVESIGDSAFKSCSRLAGVSIPDSVTYLGANAFNGCYELNSLILGDGITTIPSNAFSNCSKLTSLHIPDSVTSIGSSAFYGCSELSDIILSKQLTAIAQSAFGNCTKLIETVRGISYVDTWVVDADTSISSVRFREGTTGIADFAFSNCSALTSIIVPDSVIGIGYGAFYHCTNLESLTIPFVGASKDDTKNNFGYIFAHRDSNEYGECPASLKTLIITGGVIPNGAFHTNDCYPFKPNIIMKNGVTSIGDGAFCYAIFSSSITIPDSVISIGQGAFEDCRALTSIIIGNGIETIGEYAFDNCSNLAKVYYTGTAEEWGAVTIGSSNDPLTSATIYYYSETQPTEAGNYWHYVDDVPTVW